MSFLKLLSPERSDRPEYTPRETRLAGELLRVAAGALENIERSRANERSWARGVGATATESVAHISPEQSAHQAQQTIVAQSEQAQAQPQAQPQPQPRPHATETLHGVIDIDVARARVEAATMQADVFPQPTKPSILPGGDDPLQFPVNMYEGYSNAQKAA